jgi:hypothetical protein
VLIKLSVDLLKPYFLLQIPKLDPVPALKDVEDGGDEHNRQHTVLKESILKEPPEKL